MLEDASHDRAMGWFIGSKACQVHFLLQVLFWCVIVIVIGMTDGNGNGNGNSLLE